MKTVFIRNRKVTVYLVIIAVVVIATLLFSLGAKYRDDKASKENARKSAEKVTIEKIGKLLRLPNEDPIVSTVHKQSDFTDAKLLTDVKTGDELIIYINANQAILYRPSTNQVISIVPVKSLLKTK